MPAADTCAVPAKSSGCGRSGSTTAADPWILPNFFPIGWPQLNAVFEHGFAYARSSAFCDTTLIWQWMRLPGDVLFGVTAVLMAWDFLIKLRPLYRRLAERLPGARGAADHHPANDACRCGSGSVVCGSRVNPCGKRWCTETVALRRFSHTVERCRSSSTPP